MRSMTGYGRGESSIREAGVNFSVEISTVNRKQLDIRPNLPKELLMYDPLIRNIISEKVSRGTVFVKAEIGYAQSVKKNRVKINEELASFYYKKAHKLCDRLDLHQEIPISELLALPNVIEDAEMDFSLPKLQQGFEEAARTAVENLVNMRYSEGKRLKKDLAKRVKELEATSKAIDPLTTGIPEIHRQKLMHRLEELDIGMDLEDDRILRELVIYSDKSDVSEELTRLSSHYVQFRNFLKEKEHPVGRSLDFLIQELQREITTLGSKAACPDVTPLVVHFKTELEKVREQVQNVE